MFIIAEVVENILKIFMEKNLLYGIAVFNSGYRGGLPLGGMKTFKGQLGVGSSLEIFRHCGVKLCTYFSMGYKNISTKVKGK